MWKLEKRKSNSSDSMESYQICHEYKLWRHNTSIFDTYRANFVVFEMADMTKTAKIEILKYQQK